MRAAARTCFAPATVSNLGPGFDLLGLAIEGIGDTVTARLTAEPGVTVERKEGRMATAAGRGLRVIDLPGAYSLNPRSPDERVTCDVLYGRAAGEKLPDLVVCVVDATNLRRNLRLVLAVMRLGLHFSSGLPGGGACWTLRW
jgi:hypothetical protein